nr:hypothetical protein [Burkholderia cenocepacia]
MGVLVEDLDAAYAHLVDNGAEIVQPVTRIRAGVRGCFVRAPATSSSRCWSGARPR